MFKIDPKIIDFSKRYLNRVLFLYLLSAVLIWFGTDVKSAFNHAKYATLSRYIPSQENIALFHKDWRKLSKKSFQEFERYYEKIALFMPEVAEAKALMGFCYYYGGDKKKAQHAYTEAARQNPDFFNFHYNLGMLALEREEYKKALEHFKRSIEVDPLANVRAVSTSIVYITFLPGLSQPERLISVVGSHTHDEYRQGYLEILRTCELLKDYSSMQVYAKKALGNNFLSKQAFFYYAGLASYKLGEYQNAVLFLQEAIQNRFQYAQVFHTMGLALSAMGRPESGAAFAAAASLLKEDKVFRPEKENSDLLIF